MNKTEIKNADANVLIIGLVDIYSKIISREGFKCKGLEKEMNDIAAELMKRDLLTEDDINYLNS